MRPQPQPDTQDIRTNAAEATIDVIGLSEEG